MAYTKIGWVNDDTELSAENFNHIEDGIGNAYSVSLLAVTDTAPSECSEGDKYYNTTTNRIYTATGTDTWETTGVEPETGVFYVVFETQSNYTYDGTELISVGGGGGSSDIVVVGTDEPTEDTKLQIESFDLDAQYEVIDEKVILYSDTTGIATGTIPLSDSIQNYSYIEVYGCATLDQANCFARIPKERYDKRGNLFEFNADGNLYVKLMVFEFSNNTTINIRKNISWWKPSSSGDGGYNANENEIKIFKVVGYR